jgi:hypothetical protein
MKFVLQAIICCLIVQSCLIAQTTRSESDLVAALDLSRPELVRVKAAADRQDFAAARKAFAQYLRTRTNVVWRFDPDQPPASLTPAMRATADDALKQRFVSVNVPWQFDNGMIDWKFNPTAPPISKTALNHEWTWQFNRHAYWPALATAYHATGDKKYADELCNEIRSWCTNNPMPEKVENGPYSTWRTIEAGIRMFSSWPNTFFAMVHSPDVFDDEVLLAMVDAMRGHAEYLDKYVTTGNWKTMESNGLFHVGALFPEFKEASKWREDGLKRQNEELGIQVYPDGVQIELAPGYHNVALENFLETFTLAALNKIDTPAGYKDTLQRMFDVNLWAMLPDRTMPNFNDSGRTPVRRMLENGLALFPERQDWRWIVTDGKQGAQPDHTSHFFPWSGWAVMRSGWDKDARCLILQGGPFGYGHQHEDKLSFIIDGYGSHLVAEAGIFTYDASPMRKYVLSARGHNIISVDGLPQNRGGRPRASYVSKAPLDLGWISNSQFDYVQGSFGTGDDETWGPSKVAGPIHTRRVLFAKPDYWIVIDTLTPKDEEEHVYESAFHLDATDARVDEEAKSVTTTNQERANIAIIPLASRELNLRIVSGQKEPEMLGWIADSAYKMRAVPTAYYSIKGKGPVHFLYAFAPMPAGKSSPIARIEPAEVNDASIAAKIIFVDGAVYGRGSDEIVLKQNGTVELKRADGTILSGGRVP